MNCEAYDNEVFISCDGTSQSWRQCKWMQARVETVYGMVTTDEWPNEFIKLVTCTDTPVAKIKLWCDYQLAIYNMEMKKGEPNENPQWQGDEFM